MKDPVRIQDVYCTNNDYSKICSVTEETFASPTVPLIHQMSRFWLVTEGSGTLRLQGREYELRPGAVVSVSPWQISDIVRVTETLHFYVLAYYFYSINNAVKALSTLCSSHIDFISSMQKSPVLYCSREELAALTLSFRQLQERSGEETAGGNSSLREVAVITKLVEIVLSFLQIAEKTAATQTNGAAIQKSDILPYLYRNLSKKITLGELSARFYMSESAISDYIHQTTGFSFFDLINEMRVGKAIHLLLCTGLEQKEIADLLGFVDTPHFSKVFAERVGITAGEFRRIYKRHSEYYEAAGNPFSQDVISYIYRNYDEELTPQATAARFHMTPRDLNAVLLYQVEKDFSQFLNYVRVNRATELIKTTKKSIAEISAEVGYNNEKTLTRNFLKQRSMSLGEFRRRVQLQDARI